MRISILKLALAIFMVTSCKKDQTDPIKTGTLGFSFTANYDGAPLVVNENTYDYNGKPIRFSKVNFYLSDITLGETELFEVTFVDLTETHVTEQSSREGTLINFSKVPVGDYGSVAFGVGVSADLNRTRPEDYSTSHPLGVDNSGEYWEAWNSYIFVKIEGQYDADGDGFDAEDVSFAYHIGQDEMYKNWSTDFENPITLESDALSSVEFQLDIKKLFIQADGQLLPLTTHDPNNQLDTMRMIMSNFSSALRLVL